MPDLDEHSQSIAESTMTGTSSNSNDISILSKVAACEKLVDHAIERDLPATALADSLKELGIRANEAVDYIEEFNQRVAICRSKAREPNSPAREPPEGAVDAAPDQQERDKAVKEASWASLRSRLEAVSAAPSPDLSTNVLDKVFELLGQESSSSTSLSKSMLVVAPHLTEDENTVFEDP